VVEVPFVAMVDGLIGGLAPCVLVGVLGDVESLRD
jgi:hypothetical protein